MTVVAASGDIGAVGEPCQVVKGLTGGTFPPVKEVNLPASDPLVLGAGGTTLSANHETGAYISESAWACPSGTPAASSRRRAAALAGCSPVPATKTTCPASGNTWCRARRGFRCLSPHRDGSGHQHRAQGKYRISGSGGTSATAPLWAGLVAPADQYAGRRLGFVKSAGICRIGRSALYHKAFHGVTNGRQHGSFPPRRSLATGPGAWGGIP